MTLHLKWGVVDLTAISDDRRYAGEKSEYGRVLKQILEAGRWGYTIGACDPLGYVTVARLEVADGR